MRHCVERGAEFGERFGAVVAADDDLGQHGIVIRRDFGARFDPGFDARFARARRLASERPALGLKSLAGVFGVNANLHGAAARRWLRTWSSGVSLARGLAHHPLHEVDAGDFLGDAVLHLQACVDFEEVESAGGVVVDELDGAGVAVAHGLAQADRGSPTARRAIRGEMPGAGVSSITF